MAQSSSSAWTLNSLRADLPRQYARANASGALEHESVTYWINVWECIQERVQVRLSIETQRPVDVHIRHPKDKRKSLDYRRVDIVVTGRDKTKNYGRVCLFFHEAKRAKFTSAELETVEAQAFESADTFRVSNHAESNVTVACSTIGTAMRMWRMNGETYTGFWGNDDVVDASQCIDANDPQSILIFRAIIATLHLAPAKLAKKVDLPVNFPPGTNASLILPSNTPQSFVQRAISSTASRNTPLPTVQRATSATTIYTAVAKIRTAMEALIEGGFDRSEAVARMLETLQREGQTVEQASLLIKAAVARRDNVASADEGVVMEDNEEGEEEQEAGGEEET